MSFFVVMALCGQLEGSPKPNCSPYHTFRGIEFKDRETCLLVANERRTSLEKAFRDGADKMSRNVEKVVAYSECETAVETVRLLESNNPPKKH